MEWFVERVYQPFLSRALRWRYISLCTAISVLLLAIGLVKGGFLKFEGLPKLDGFIITTNVEFPAGTPPASPFLRPSSRAGPVGSGPSS